MLTPISQRTVIPAEKPGGEPPPPRRLRRRRVINTTAGVVILGGLLAAVVALFFFAGSWLDEPTIHVVTYLPGTVDIEPGVDITYNGNVVGTIDSAKVNLRGTQIFLSRIVPGQPVWHVVTFLSGRSDTARAGDVLIAASADGIHVGEYVEPGEHTTGTTDLLAISASPGGTSGRLVQQTRTPMAAINGREAGNADSVVESGDEIGFVAHGNRYALRWTGPGPYTAVYGRIAYKQLARSSLVKTDSCSVINSSASLNISNTFGLTRTSARFGPTFDRPLIEHSGGWGGGSRAKGAVPVRPPGDQLLVEMRSGGETSLDEVQSTLDYLTSRSSLKRPPANRLEYMASNIDTTIGGIKRSVSHVGNRTLPGVDSVIAGAHRRIDILGDSLRATMALLDSSIHMIAGTANSKIGTLADSTAATLGSLQLRIDLLMEEVRKTTTQLRRTVREVGSDIHNVTH